MSVSTEMKTGTVLGTVPFATGPGCESAGNGATASEAPSALRQALGKITAADLKEAARRGAGVAANLALLGLGAYTLANVDGTSVRALSSLGYWSIAGGIAYGADQVAQLVMKEPDNTNLETATGTFGILAGAAMALSGITILNWEPMWALGFGAISIGLLAAKGLVSLHADQPQQSRSY